MRNINFETILKIFANYDPSLLVEYFKVKPGSQKAHYCSLMYTIEVAVTDKKGTGENHDKKILMMIKTIPDNPFRLQFIQDGKFFIKEIEMYVKIIPEIMKPCGFSEAFPSIYYTFGSPAEDNFYIVMEDLTDIGFKPYSKRIYGLDENHTKLVIKKLAHFHAASFIKYRGDGIQMEEDFPSIKEHFWKTDLETKEVPEMNHAFMFNTFEQIRKLLIQKGRPTGIPPVERLMSIGHETLSKLGKRSEKYPNTITHGDAWTTNFLFKYDDDEGTLLDIKFVDFQMSRITSRITDLAYFIYTSVHSDLINENLEQLLQLYFDQFNKICEQHGGMHQPLISHQGIELTWEYFQEEWNDYKIYGQLFGLLYIPIMYTDPNNSPDMENLDETDLNLRSDDTKGNFDDMWSYKPMQDKLFNLIFNHLPR